MEQAVEKIGDYDQLMDETEDSSEDVDEDEQTEEEGSELSDEEVEALKSEKGDETEAIKEETNKTAVSFLQVESATQRK